MIRFTSVRRSDSISKYLEEYTQKRIRYFVYTYWLVLGIQGEEGAWATGETFFPEEKTFNCESWEH